MARKVDYSKRVEKIKDQLDELVAEIANGPKKEEIAATQKIKISDIDFESEELPTLMKIQSRLMRVIQTKIKG